MYQRKSEHRNSMVLLLDCLCMLAGLMIGNTIRNGRPFYSDNNKVSFGLLYAVCVLVFLALHLFRNMYREMLYRGPLHELFYIIGNNVALFCGITVILYYLKLLEAYSRMVFVYFILLSSFFMFLVHQLWKRVLPFMYRHFWETRKLLLVTDTVHVREAVQNVKGMMDFSYELTGIALWDRKALSQDQETIEEISLLTGRDGLLEYCQNASLDEVLIALGEGEDDGILAVMETLAQMGIAIHYKVPVPYLREARRKVLSHFGRYDTVTYANRFVPAGQLLLKRLMDLTGSLIGCTFLLPLTLLVGPFIKLESPGPVFFCQKRVGRNGRIFKMYKFRSMYFDAEARKQELIERNEIKGLMFKMDKDPRITKIGSFLRRTSLDEFPQFLNILRGDMSLVGTRPPTIDEFAKYNPYHKKRLSFRPGLTGMWQVSGRSNITDFEEIVRLDVEYIDNWTIGLDIKILLKTIVAVFGRRGAK